jgi:DNA-binding transcriptional LysR family regulator
MDIKVFKTFLEVAKEKHFGKSAENLFITQAAVSARIKQLEQYFDVELFVRDKSNIRLTPAGERLQEYAITVVEQLKQAKLNLALAEREKVLIKIAATPNIWDDYLAKGISTIVRENTEISLGAEISVQESIHRRLQNKTFDIGILLDPIKEDEFQNAIIGTLDLVLVSAKANMTADSIEKYVLVDWGMAYLKEHNKIHKLKPILRTSTAKIALDVILESEGAAYLPYALVLPYIEEGDLHIIETELTISRNIYFTHQKYHPFPEQITLIKEILQKSQL